MQERTEEHDDGAGAARGLDVDGVEIEGGWGDDLQVIGAGEPPSPHADRTQDLDDPIDLFDTGQAAQGRAALVEQRCAQQGDRGILGGLDVDAPRQLVAALDA